MSKVIAYKIVRQAYQTNNGADQVRCLLEDGTVTEEGHFPQMHWSYSDRFKDARVISFASNEL